MSQAVVGVGEVKAAFRDLELVGRPVEVHVSLRSFGGLQRGPATIVDGVLAAGSTVLAATMAPDLFGIPAPLDDRPARNGLDYPTVREGTGDAPVEGPIGVYEPARTRCRRGWARSLLTLWRARTGSVVATPAVSSQRWGPGRRV